MSTFGGSIDIIGSDEPNNSVFLGGTYNNSTWRDDIIPMLEEINVNYFNPIVDNWDEEAKQKEIQERETSAIALYVITNEMKGVYSIAEATDDSNKRPCKTIFCVLEDGFDEQQISSLKSTGDLITRNGGTYTTSLEETIEIIRKKME